MWYENVFRRHLCDMHIDDWNEEFLSRFSPEKYLENLKMAKIQNAMLYFQSHVGLCYYPTACGKMHSAFSGRENMMKNLADMCKADGINVTGYYSLVYNNWAYDTHPEWRMITEKGIPFPEEKRDTALECARGKHVNRYKFCCPNNLDYREFTAKQIEEIADISHLTECFSICFSGRMFAIARAVKGVGERKSAVSCQGARTGMTNDGC